MPLYTFYSSKKNEYRDIFFSMKAEKQYNGADGLEVGEWKRIYHPPNVSVDILPIDPYSSKEFVKATNKKGTVGDMLDLSAELSEKREKQEGEDPVKRKYFNEYEKKNKAKHLADTKKQVENNSFKIDFTKKNNSLKLGED